LVGQGLEAVKLRRLMIGIAMAALLFAWVGRHELELYHCDGYVYLALHRRGRTHIELYWLNGRPHIDVGPCIVVPTYEAR
jgi:hypothetical protein